MRAWVLCIVLGVGLLGGSAARADIPQPIIQQTADFRVQQAQLKHLTAIGKLTDREAFTQANAIEAQITALWQPYRQASAQDVSSARTAIDRLVTDKISLLRPQWDQEESAYKTAGAQHNKQLFGEADDDARRAAEFQRQRVVLQQQLSAGKITQDAFAAQDKQAADAIAALRQKYDAEGKQWSVYFDQRYNNMLSIALKNPNAPMPQATVPVGATGTPDFAADVKAAADLAVRREENQYKYDKKQIDATLMGNTDAVINHDLARLRARYDALVPKRGAEFETAYLQAAAPRIQALKAQYYPGQVQSGTAPPLQSQGTSSSSIEDIIIIVVFGGVLFGLWRWMRSGRAPADQAPPLSKNYGTAAWAEVRQRPLSDRDISQGVFFGKSSRPDIPAGGIGAPVTSLPETHTLIVARTRAGKGTRVIVPTLLRYGGSMLVIDPKGENAAITARTRSAQLGQAVHIVNPWGEMESHYKSLGFSSATFNPLDAIDRNDPNAVAFAQSLAAIICPPAPGKEQYWQGSAANVLAGVFLWLADTPGEQKTLARARQIITTSRADFGKILARMVTSTAYHGAVSEMVSQYVDLAPETYSAIMSNLAENTKFLSDPRIKASTASSSFSMKALGQEAMTVYLVIPHDRIQTHATWLRLVISAAMQGMKSHKSGTAPRHRCMFLIDEFGSIGRIDDIPRDIALMSGYGLDFTLIVQGLDQLKDHYGDARGTILSNCAFQWYCYVNELETAKHLSESLGKATVRTVGKSMSSGQSASGQTAGESTTFGETGRPLLNPDEILNLGRDAAILLNPRGAPDYLRPVDYWNLAGTFAPLKAEYPKFYWDPPLQYDENPYFKRQQEQRHQPPPRGKGKMTRAEALKVFGLQEDATTADISAAYKRLMLKTHPDTGGTDYFAQKLNEAREVLLG